MKTIFKMIVVMISLNAFAQKPQYSTYRHKYDVKNYDINNPDNRYSPVLATALSTYIPGTGQMYCREGGRGLAFMAAYIGCVVTWSTGLSNLYITGTRPPEEFRNRKLENAADELFLYGCIGGISLRIWSAIDANRLAKVKNMAIAEGEFTSVKLRFEPYSNIVNNNFYNGVTAKITF